MLAPDCPKLSPPEKLTIGSKLINTLTRACLDLLQELTDNSESLSDFRPSQIA
jgi:hypothetical protein